MIHARTLATALLFALSACAGQPAPHMFSPGTEVPYDDWGALLRRDGALPTCEQNPASCTTHGAHYEMGVDAAPSDAAAVRWYDAGCAAGDLDGCVLLASMIEQGRGAPPDPALSASLYARACRQGHALACARLGWMVETGAGPARDATKAAGLYRQACVGGDGASCLNLGRLDERAAPPAYAEAVWAYELACDRGDGAGCTQLGRLVERGLGVERDLVRAQQLYWSVCERPLGDDVACALLGELVLGGRVRRDDRSRATELVALTCARDGAASCEVLARLAARTAGGAPARVRALYGQACAGGELAACVITARMLAGAVGGPAEPQRAARLLERACGLGEPSACAPDALARPTDERLPTDALTRFSPEPARPARPNPRERLRRSGHRIVPRSLEQEPFAHAHPVHTSDL